MAQDNYVVTTVLTQPIDFPAAAAWCRDIETADQVLVEELIKAAVLTLESMTNRVFVKRVYTGSFSNLCYSKFENYPFVKVRKAPFSSLAEIRINGVALTSTEYELKASSGFSKILIINPPTLNNEAYPIKVDFVAGYGYETPINISSLTRVGSTVTAVTEKNHLLNSGNFPVIEDADDSGYDGQFEITVVDNTSFTYEISGTPVTPDIGTPTVKLSLPDDIKTMIQQTVLFWYENRGDISTDAKQQIPFVAKQILKRYRIVDTF